MSSLSKSGGLSLKSRFPLFGTSEQPATAPGLWMGLTHPRFARSPATPGVSLSRHRRHREGHRHFPWGGVRRNAILRVLSTLPKVEKARQTGGLWVCVCVCMRARVYLMRERRFLYGSAQWAHQMCRKITIPVRSPRLRPPPEPVPQHQLHREPRCVPVVTAFHSSWPPQR